MRKLVLLLFCCGGISISAQLFNIKNIIKLEYDWQIKIAEKTNKTILDYYLLLPSGLIHSGMNSQYGPLDSFNYRIQLSQKSLSKVNIKNGFLRVDTENDAFLFIALFKDAENKLDIIAYVLGCGELPVQSCDYGFMIFDSNRKVWKNANYVFPFKEMDRKCLKIEKKKKWYDEKVVSPYLGLPEFGTTIRILDAYSNEEHLLFKAKWNGKKFQIQ